MSRTLVQFSLLTLLVLASMSDAFAQSSSNRQPSEVMGNHASSRMTVIKEPVREPAAKTDRIVAQAFSQQPAVRVTVMGQVWAPGVYEFRQGAPTLKALTEQSGGLTGYCAHQFYVFKANEESLKLERDQYDDYQFEDGDILLAETAARHYKALGSPAARHTLVEIHPKTQIVLLNVLDRPVLLSLSPEDADLAYLLSLLNQNRTAMVGVEQIVPPNASSIPQDAIIAPDMIFSGSILRFVPNAVDRTTLPQLPDPIQVQLSPKVQVLAGETAQVDTGWTRDPGSLMVQPVKSKSQSGIASEQGETSKIETQLAAESSSNPFEDAFAQFEESSDEVLNSDAPKALVPVAKTSEGRALLSAQQWRIIVTFVTLMVLFLSAWYIRHRQQKNGIKTFNFVESRIGSSSGTTAAQLSQARSPEPPADETATDEPQIANAEAEASEPTSEIREAAVQSRIDAPQGEVLELERLKIEGLEESGPEQNLANYSFELSAYDSARSENFIDEATFEVTIDELGSSHEIEVFDPVEWPREAVAEVSGSKTEQNADESLQEEAHADTEAVEEEPSTRVQQSLLGTPWWQEISNGLDPHESDIALEKQPVDAPEAREEIEEAQRQPVKTLASGRFASQQLRIDQAHTDQPTPPTQPPTHKLSSEPDNVESDRVKPPSAASKWLRMEDAPRQPEENLDYIFQSIMRDRKK